MSTQVAAVNPNTGRLEEKHVEWFKTKYTRHICLAHHDSPVGRSVNPWTISLLRYWLKSVFVPVDRKFSVVNAVIHYSNKKLSTYFKDSVRLTLQPGKEERVKFIRPANNGPGAMKNGQFRLPQVALDASGLMLTRPDSFMPPVDIVVEEGSYTVFMDVPGLSAKGVFPPPPPPPLSTLTFFCRYLCCRNCALTCPTSYVPICPFRRHNISTTKRYDYHQRFSFNAVC